MAQMQIFLYTVGEVMVNLFFFKYFKMTHISFGALNAMQWNGEQPSFYSASCCMQY